MDGPQNYTTTKSIPGSDTSRFKSPFLSTFRQLIPVNMHKYTILMIFTYLYMLKIMVICAFCVLTALIMINYPKMNVTCFSQAWFPTTIFVFFSASNTQINWLVFYL